MIAEHCPNCNCIKEISREVIEDQAHCICLSCNKTWSYTISKPVEIKKHQHYFGIRV